MRIGDLEILASLNRDGDAYSSQEDVYLKVVLKNLGDGPAAIPYLLEHPAEYVLKDKGTGSEKKAAYAPPATPGTPEPDPHPEASVGPGDSVVYNLLVRFPLGFIPAGTYSLRYAFDFPGLPFASDWMDFTVLGLKVGGIDLNPSSTGPSERLHLAWIDLAAKPQRILFQRSFIGEQRPLVPRTLVVGAADAPGAPTSSISPSGMDAEVVWIGWVAQGQLALTRVTGNDSVKGRTFPLPAKTAWSLVPNLNYSEAPGGSNAVLSGLLMGKDGQGYSFTGFTLADSSGPAWLQPFRLPAGDMLAARLIPFSPHRRMALWIRKGADSLKVEGMEWDDTKGFGPLSRLAEIPASAGVFKSLDACMTGSRMVWGVALHKEVAPGKPGTLSLVTHGWNALESRTAAGVPKTRSFQSRPGPLRIVLKFAEGAKAWVLERDADGTWLQAEERDTLIAVESPRGTGSESLFFRNRSIPKILRLNPETGFESKGVAIPVEGEDDRDED
ncbi:MAG: hypothetical protein JWP91_3042 [Fibrobacteres bacterium]|nr:hypothetical protein [Fibrobacterota bacterium]